MSAVISTVLDTTIPASGYWRIFSVAFEPGTHTVLTGKNSSGMETLLALAAGVLQPLRGFVSLSSSRRPALVLQHTTTPETMPCTVRQAVEMGRWPHRRGLLPLRSVDRQVVSAAMQRMGIADLAARQLRELSGGQQQRTLLAQGMAQESDILILDEPTAGFDMAARRLIRTVIEEELRRGVTVLESSHDPGDIQLAERVITLENGRMAADTLRRKFSP